MKLAGKEQKNAARKSRIFKLCMVETTGFEPATSWSRTKRSTKLSHVSMSSLTDNELDYSIATSKKEERIRSFFCPLNKNVCSGYNKKQNVPNTIL